MSFIENNKAWILPLLGVGVAGVLYLNLRSTPSASPPPTSEAVAPQDPAAIPTAVPEKPAESATGDLWADLRVFAAPPSALADESRFRDQARTSALAALKQPALPADQPIPSSVREPAPAVAPATAATVESTTEAQTSLPVLDFLIHGPAGARAWVDGHPYRIGEAIPGQALSVGPIGFTSVELKGPKGKTVLSTNPLHQPRPLPRSAVEAP